MFSRSHRKLILPGFGLLAVGVIVLSACAAGDAANAGKQASDPIVTSATAIAPSVAAPPAIATIPSAAKSAATRKSAGATRKSAGPDPSAVPDATVYGVSDPNLLNQSAAVQVEQLKAIKAMGFTSVRLDASWYWGQSSGPGSFDWAGLDQAVASIREVGLSADLIVDGCPPWAAVAGAQGQFAQPASSAAFATWAGAVAARYSIKGIRYFEIWNEPNLAVFWQPKPDPAAYTADLKAAYAAIKAVDPSAVVLSGGLAPADNDGTDIDPRTFLQDMYADGAKGSFDELGFHPYSYPDSPDTVASWSGWSMMADTNPSIRSIMTQNGDSGKKIWITEYGVPTIGPNSVGETGQSTDLVQAISQVRKLDWIGSLYIYTWSDISTLPADQNGFGLLTDQDVPKPAYSAVATALAPVG